MTPTKGLGRMVPTAAIAAAMWPGKKQLTGPTYGGPWTLIVGGPLPSLNAIELDTSPLGFPSR